MTDEIAISLQGVSKTYHLYRRPEDRLKQLVLGRFGADYDQSYHALEGITLEVRRGETVGLIGRNGAGKSTLLQIVCGTLTPTTGEIMVNGRVAAMIELGAGFNPEFTGRENVRLSATVAGLSKREIEQRLPSIVEFAGIGDFIDQPVKLYSSGMYARLAFAVSAHVDADILVVDEILSVGDATFGQKCQRFINEFKKRGTLLFVSHDVGTVINLCDRAVWLERGHIRASGPVKEITERYLRASSEEKDGGEDFNVGRARGARPPRAPDFRKSLSAGPVALCDIAVSGFDADAPWSGVGGASIIDVAFLDAEGKPRSRLAGGEMVKLSIRCHAMTEVYRALIGFQIIDDRGQGVLGGNTNQAYLDRPLNVAPGQEFGVVFDLEMPYLRSGTYHLTVAISDGTQTDHIHHQWMNDSVTLVVVASGAIRGLIGVQMRSIETIPGSVPP
jgi:lipopolysaccharide transport system ATP-binding protein